MQKWKLSFIFISLLAFGLACANEPPVTDQASSSSLSAEQVEQIVSKALEGRAMQTAPTPAGPTAEEIGTIVSEAVAEARRDQAQEELAVLQAKLELAQEALAQVPAESPPAREITDTLKHGGVERTYHVHFPPGSDRSKEHPLAVLLHGFGSTGAFFDEGSGNPRCWKLSSPPRSTKPTEKRRNWSNAK